MVYSYIMRTKGWTIPVIFVLAALTLFAPPITHAETSTITIEEGKYYLFVATGCPHCADVEKYIKTNNIDEYLDIEVIDIAVQTDKQTAFLTLCRERVSEEMANQVCGSVPEMIYGDQIFVGADEIINHFKTLDFSSEPVDWGKWVVIGLIGGSALIVGGLMLYPLIDKK